MRNSLWVAAMLVFCWAAVGRADQLQLASVHLERNVTDQDGEAFIEVKAGECALRWLRVERPDGIPVAYYNSQGRRGLGGQQLVFETPEPSVDAVVQAYPPGVYKFIGRTLCGDDLTATAPLVRTFPRASQFTFPADGAEDISPVGLRIEWTPVAGVDHYVVELEQKDLGLAFKTPVPAGTTALSIPDELLRPGVEYQIGIGTFSVGGNGSFFESTFTTAD